MRSLSLLSCLGLVTLLAACASSADPSPSVGPTSIETQGGPPGLHGQPEPGEAPMLGLHRAKGGPGGHTGGGSSPLMTWHNGAILTDSAVTAIFWGKSWGDAGFTADKMDGLDRLYSGLGDTTYASSNTEYTGLGLDGTPGQSVGTSTTYSGHLVDTSVAPTRAPKTSAILAEVCKMIGTPVANGYYPVYTDTKRGSAGYCAWHSYGTCGGVPVQFGFFFNLDGDSGCDPQDTDTAHSQGLAALANVSGHEWSETVSDPRNGGWWDASGNENADKCAWSFPPTPVVLGGESWKIQGNWSNAAYTASSGYLNRDGQAGCLPNL